MNLEAQVNNMRARLERLHKKIGEDHNMDFVTGLPNHVGFCQLFDEACQNIREGKSQGGTLVLIDLDNFDDLQFRHGKYVASLCLKQVSDQLQNTFLYRGQAAYVGRGEFAVLVPDCPKNHLIEEAQVLRTSLDKIIFRWRGKLIAVKSSIGLHAYSPFDCVERLFSFGNPEDSVANTMKARQSSGRGGYQHGVRIWRK